MDYIIKSRITTSKNFCIPQELDIFPTDLHNIETTYWLSRKKVAICSVCHTKYTRSHLKTKRHKRNRAIDIVRIYFPYSNGYRE